jgi:hypothetical protein
MWREIFFLHSKIWGNIWDPNRPLVTCSHNSRWLAVSTPSVSVSSATTSVWWLVFIWNPIYTRCRAVRARCRRCSSPVLLLSYLLLLSQPASTKREKKEKRKKRLPEQTNRAVFSCPDLVAAKSLFLTVAHCSILFFSAKNCPKID